MNKLIPWIRAFRLPFHTALIFSFTLGNVLAWSAGLPFKWGILTLGLVAVFLATSNCFLANEYFDYPTDRLNKEYNPFTGGSRVLPEALLPRRQVLLVALTCMFGAMIVGAILHFSYQTGSWTIPMGALGLFAAYFYTAKPIQLAYRGLGEVAIGLIIGWLTVFSGYYLQSQHFSWLPTIVSLPWVMAVVLLIWINEFPDYASDRISNKKNLVVRLGKEKAAWVHNGLITLMWLLSIPILFLAQPKVSLLFLLIPFFLSAWNLIVMARGGWRDGEILKGLCARTILYAISLSLALIGIFL